MSLYIGSQALQAAQEMNVNRVNLPSEEIVVRIRQTWVQLTDKDLQHGLKHRDTFLDRLRHRHNLGLDEAEAQLREFEKKNPELLFEKS